MANDPFDFDLEDAGLGKLEKLGNFYERNADQAVESDRAARGMGNARGSSSMDDFARDYRQKQTKIDREINDRLWDRHQNRSKKARIADESKDAELADSAQQWFDNPAEFDWPGIDTKR